MEKEKTSKKRYPRAVRWWLYAGLIMIFLQVVIGGITRLTESGLSITKWEILSGVLPPLNQEEWRDAFQLYKETPQYEQVFRDMSLSEFKYIYFWEYVHRLWARLIGFVFAIPLVYFLWKKWLDRKLVWRLVGLVLLGMLVASFGWIMVASGLEDRPWVDAYKLTGHLLLGIALFVYMAWIALDADFNYRTKNVQVLPVGMKSLFVAISILVFIQLTLGGMMSGMKAGLFYPSWPTMNGNFIPTVILDASQWNVENFKQYDKHLFAPAVVQFLHRSVAYILFIIGIYGVFKFYKSVDYPLKGWLSMFGIVLIVQLIVGIVTVLQSRGEVPVFWGVTHQALALLLVLSLVGMFYFMKKKLTAVSD